VDEVDGWMEERRFIVGSYRSCEEKGKAKEEEEERPK
jgi:hypothetical protein